MQLLHERKQRGIFENPKVRHGAMDEAKRTPRKAGIASRQLSQRIRIMVAAVLAVPGEYQIT